MRNLERRRHQEDLLYHIVAYLVSLDKLFDDQAKLLREQISRAEQAEVTVKMYQVRVAQAEARTAATISSEAIAHESLRQIQDQHMQEWNNSGTPVLAIG
jgi:phage-related minor tail protein